MSLANLQLAVRNQLRTRLPIVDAATFPLASINDVIDLQAGGQPPPAAGQLYLAIHGIDWSAAGAEKQRGTEEVFGVAITISRKIGSAPKDRQTGAFYADAVDGLDRIARLITPEIHQNYVVMNAANTLMGSPAFGFQEPLRLIGGDPEPTIVGPEWWEGDTETKTNAVPGWTLQIRFGNAVRIQELSVMT